MNGVTRNVWKGGVLGAILGMVGSFLFSIIATFYISLISPPDNLFDFILGFVLVVFFYWISYGILPGVVAGLSAGGILGGVFAYLPVAAPGWKKVSLKVLVSGFTASILYKLVFINILVSMQPNFSNPQMRHLELFFNLRVPAYLLYIAAAVWFGMNFHRKTVWTPKILFSSDRELT